MLAAYGIPTVADAGRARRRRSGGRAPSSIGYPVVLKLYSETITHKTDVGGVQLNLRDADGGAQAPSTRSAAVGTEKAGAEHFQGVTVQPMVKLDGYEMIIGSSIDPQFGPVLLFGTGGQLVEVFKDRALGAAAAEHHPGAPHDGADADLQGAARACAGRAPVDLAALEELLVRFSQLVVEQPWIKEIDINPLLASPDGCIALDARVVVHGPEVDGGRRCPSRPSAPIPASTSAQWTMKDGTAVTIRPIRPEDEPLMVQLPRDAFASAASTCATSSLLKLSQRIAHERLTRICFIDYDREMALVAVHTKESGPEVMAVGRLSKLHGVNEAECAVLISDLYQHQGLGSELFRRLLEVARAEKIGRVVATMLAENREMRSICKRLGFRVHIDMEDQLVRAEVETK